MLSTFSQRFYQVPSKYSDGYLSYRADTNSISNKTKGDNSKRKKARVVTLVYDTLSFLFYINTKYYKNILKGICVTEQTQNQIQTQGGEVTPIVRKPKLSVLYMTRHLILLYFATMYHKNIPKYI